MAKVLLGVLFADGANGLKYGCEEATKYFAEEALVFPFFVVLLMRLRNESAPRRQPSTKAGSPSRWSSTWS